MKQLSLATLMLSSALLATPEVNSISEVFSEAKTSGNIKYYYIQTDKDFDTSPSTSANANSIGGQLSFDTASLYGVSGGVTFMTTNPFLLDDTVDTSIIGKDNGARLNAGLNAPYATDSFSVLGEAYIQYAYSDFNFLYGRQVVKTPLLHAKEVRMLPSAVQGAFASYKLAEKSKLEVAYIDRFKQRTSNQFMNIIEHALGGDTELVTGSTDGYVVMAGADYKVDDLTLKAYDYYAQDFLNSAYIDVSYKLKIADAKVTFAAQYINQTSIGNADNYFENNASYAGGTISSNAFGAKTSISYGSAKFLLAYSNVLRDDGSHDSLVLPWDGTPLFTNMITSNDLFQSIYGSALKSDSIYIGGSQGIKIAYSQNYDFLGLDGISSTLAYLNTSNDKFLENQQDYNLVLAYKHSKKFALALKGIWVQNNSGASADGTVSQLKLLSQYRVIANYKF